MGRSRVKLDFAGFKALRQSPEARAAINAEAQAMAERANANRHINGAQYDPVPAIQTKQGSVALVHTSNVQAKVDQANYRTLERSLGG